MKIFKFSIMLFMLVAPQLASAAKLHDLIDASYDLVNNILIPIAFSLCLLYFFWGIAKYIRVAAGSEVAAEEGKRIMIWGVVGLFVVFSIWGIINLLKSELGVPNITEVRSKP